MTMNSFKAKAIFVILAVFTIAVAVSGCTTTTPTPTPTAVPTATPTPTPAAGPAMLTITGMVNTPLDLTLADLNAYAQHPATWQNNAGNSSYTGTGPYVLDLLNKAGLKESATNVTFECTDPAAPFSNTIKLSDLKGTYNDTIIAYNWTGINKQGLPVTNTNKTLRVIAPQGGGKNQVDNVSKITVS